MTVVCYRWDGWPVAVAIADVSVLQETFNTDAVCGIIVLIYEFSNVFLSIELSGA